MNKFEKMLSKWKFRKIAIVFIVVAIVLGIGCTALVGVFYRERINFAWQYSRLEKYTDNPDALKSKVSKAANASGDIVDILILNDKNNITYSAKNSAFAGTVFSLTKYGDEKKYLASPEYPDAVFRYVKNDEFMLNSIFNTDFGKIKEDYDDDIFYESDLSSKNIYMLSCTKNHDGSIKLYVISTPSSVAGGKTVLKISASLAMLLFCIYWVLVALWMYKDATKSKMSALLWGLIGLFTNLIGLIVYKIYIRSSAVCKACGAVQSQSHMFCSFCGNRIGTICKKCGGKISPKDSFCHHCGSEVKENE